MSITPQALDRACAEIFLRWCGFVPEAEAQRQADAFRARCLHLGQSGALTEAELDATLALVSDCMAEDA